MEHSSTLNFTITSTIPCWLYSYGPMSFKELVEIMDALRADNGCPWDKEQTRESLIPFLLEEAYEVVEALNENDPEQIKEELGDLLFQIVFHARIAKEKEEFDVNDIIEIIGKKLIDRHPHVFGKAEYKTSEEISRQWEERKKEEGKCKESILEGIPGTLPSLLRAYRIQQRVSKIGFDWNRVEDVIDKLDEEMDEFKKAVLRKSQDEIENELGDLFFSLVNLSRFVSVDPENALRKAITRFVQRFGHIEKRAKELEMELFDLTLEEMDRLWNEAKKQNL